GASQPGHATWTAVQQSGQTPEEAHASAAHCRSWSGSYHDAKPPSGGGCRRLRQARQARRIAMPIGHSPGGPGDYVFYVSIQGAKQGKFKGEGAHAHKNVIPAHSFSYEVISPRDVATGQATGKRQHSPVTISKEWGAASPQLFQAAVTNEPLQSVLFEFPVTDARGVEVVHH